MIGMDPERPPLASVEAVREELKRLGYLESGLDRFVLAGAESDSPLRASVGVAARVGVLGGPLFGIVSTLAAVGLDRRLLGEPRDLAVLAAYLTILFAVATAFAAGVGGLVAAWAGRRLGHRPGPTLARNVGLGVALLGLGYFALWWRSHLVGASLAAHVMALVLGLGVAFVLGRFGWQAAVAVLAAGGAGDRLPPASLSRRNVVPLLATAAVLVGSGVAAATWLRPQTTAEAPDFAVVPTGLRVRVIGIDGLERRMTDQMRERGDMPHLEILLRGAAHGRLKAEPERVPAIVWTTIATGRGPEVHGIRSSGARRIPGLRTPLSLEEDESPFAAALSQATDLLRLARREPPTAVLRGAKTFWNVASEKGLRVGVVNWWATWPADAVNGYVVTDRAFFKLEKGGPPEGEVFPSSDFERLRPLLPEKGAERAQALDRFHVAAATLLRAPSPPDLEAVYLPGLDIFTMQRLSDTSGADLATLDARLMAVREEYRLVDGLLGELVAGSRPEDVLVLVGDPGRFARATDDEPEGLVALAGPAVQGGDLGLVSSRDIAPTVLHLAGLPASAELDGRVLEAALTPSFLSTHPVRRVATYGRRPPSRAGGSAFDRDVLEELRSLGYIK
jgi:Type I phosphodiesterase / nucleotide pyrophosphatase